MGPRQSGGGFPYAPFVTNVKKSNTTILGTGLFNAKNNTGTRQRWIQVGDSTRMGLGTATADATGSPGGRYALSPTQILKDKLNGLGYVTKDNAVLGGKNVSGAANAYNTYRPGVTGATIVNAAADSFDGHLFSTSSANIFLQLATDGNVDTGDFYILDLTSPRTILVVTAAVTRATFSQVGTANTPLKNNQTFPSTTAVKIQNGSGGGGINFLGMELYAAGETALTLINAGWGGSKVTDWTNTTNIFGPLPFIDLLGAVHYSFGFGANDNFAGVTPTQFKTNYGVLLDRAVAAGAEFHLETPFPASSTQSPTLSIASQDAIAQAVRDLAATYDVPLVDKYAGMGSWVALNSAGLEFDSIHLNNYAIPAALDYELCRQAVLAI